jgi:hypothetical protein
MNLEKVCKGGFKDHYFSSPCKQGGHTGPPLRMNGRIVGADLCVRPAGWLTMLKMPKPWQASWMLWWS